MKEKRGVRRGEKGCAGLGRPPAPRHKEASGQEVEAGADKWAPGASEKERKRGEGVGWAGMVGWAEQAD